MAYMTRETVGLIEAGLTDTEFAKRADGGGEFHSVERIDPATGNRTTSITNQAGLDHLDEHMGDGVDAVGIAKSIVAGLDLDSVVAECVAVVKKIVFPDGYEIVTADEIMAVYRDALAEAVG
jgi:hypothetical protein